MDLKEEINSINLYLGASDVDKPRQVLGGYGALYNIGNNTTNRIRNSILEWRYALKSGTEANKIRAANEILNLKSSVADPKMLCGIIRELCNLPTKDILKFLSKSLNLAEPLEIALRRLYYVWSDLIEVALEILNNVKPPADLSDKIKSYEHQGYCPLVPIKRIQHLFTFPIDEALEFIEIQCGASKKIDFNTAYKNVVVASTALVDINPAPLFDIKIKICIPTNETVEATLDFHMDKLIELYKLLYSTLQKKEELYISNARLITKICDEVEKIILEML